MRTRVKICGITNAADLAVVVDAGADAVGLIMAEDSPRYISIETAADLAARVAPYVTVVGLFANAPEDTVRRACESVPFDMLQFQGDETDEYCSRFGHRFIKALRVRAGMDVASVASGYPHSAGLHLDTYVEGAFGGTGVTFDWRQVPQIAGPIVLAGGLGPDNVGEAIRAAHPWAVDVCSGVEASPGKKDHDKVRAFVAAVKAADEV
ncbi:MAG TPA: phosphoribosylanthranilate isomerase [Pseudomonadales bacterium]|nr:phosphoribosylanthranilate isomerase [Pseudomonadales bacterium]